MAGMSSAVSAATRVFTWSGIPSSCAQPHGPQSAVEGAGDAADGIVARGSGAVEAQPQAFHLVFLEPHQHVARERLAGGGSDGDADAELVSLVDEIVEILAGQRIAAGENQLRHGVAESRDLAQELHAFLERELVGVGLGHRLGAAMAAGQRASLRHFPVDVHRRPRVIAGRVARVPKVRVHARHTLSVTPRAAYSRKGTPESCVEDSFRLLDRRATDAGLFRQIRQSAN